MLFKNKIVPYWLATFFFKTTHNIEKKTQKRILQNSSLKKLQSGWTSQNKKEETETEKYLPKYFSETKTCNFG